jgi:hypothetical protein
MSRRPRLVDPVHFGRDMTRLRLLLAAAALPVLTACTAIVPIDVTRQVPVESSGTSFSANQVIDFAQQPDVWSHRDNIDAISIDDVTATVISVGDGHLATSVTVTVSFRPDGATDAGHDLQVGTFPALAFQLGSTVTLHGSAALDAFLLDALKGSGKFTAFASGALDGAANAVVEVRLKGSAAYKVVG